MTPSRSRGKATVLAVLLILPLTAARAADRFDLTPALEQAYHHIVRMEVDPAEGILDSVAGGELDNGCYHLMRNYAAFLDIYTRGGVNDYKARKHAFDDRLQAIQRNDATDSPWSLYAQGEVALQLAVLHIKYGEYFAAIWDIRRADRTLSANHERFPDFAPNRKAYGLLLTILGSVPDQYSAGLRFLGLDGHLTHGMRLIGSVVDDPAASTDLRKEAAVLQAFLELHIMNDAQAALAVVRGPLFDASDALVDAFSVAHIGVYGGDQALAIEQAMRHPQAPDFADLPHMNYLLGLGHLQQLDPQASPFFTRFIRMNRDRDHVKAAHHKLGWLALIEGDTVEYQRRMALVRTVGAAVIDADKQAVQEAEGDRIPNPTLLRARLLTDGGDAERALALLASRHVNHFSSTVDKTEYFYRMARIHHQLGQWDDAIPYYELTLRNGQSLDQYFAANAAFQLGWIHEERGDLDLAARSYHQALDMEGYPYENSIRQKAKAGLGRVE
mgnify:CR=1 FL=1